ncbi:MAG: hypothetical protein IT306_20550 [Chloroflexi bacterium]|nr:hypothetical protein [Chloroflexota bacterium]
MLVAAFALTTLPAAAATITVDAIPESWDHPAGPGTCTLFNAVKAANTDTAVAGCATGSGTDTIVFNIAIAGTDPLDATGTDGAIVVTTPMIIDGFTQPGARANSLPSGNNAVWRIVISELQVSGTGSTVQGLWIGGRFVEGRGVSVSGTGHSLRGNLIFGNSGRVTLGGSNNLYGGSTPADRNIITENDPIGADIDVSVILDGTANRVQGNYFGTDAAATRALGSGENTGTLLVVGERHLIGGTDPGAGNLFVGSTIFHLSLGWWWWMAQENPTIKENQIEGNTFGVMPNGTVTGGYLQVQGAPDNVIGGTAPGAGNVIAGTVGVFGSAAAGTKVQGNAIGLPGAPGSVWLDGATGVTVGGAEAGARNVITGGVTIGRSQSVATSTGNIIAGNTIGPPSGSVPNVGGIRIEEGSNNTIGGVEPGAGNTIQFAGGPGVVVVAGTGNAILGNSIQNSDGLGIDLAADGVTQNDAGDGDSGPNRRQNTAALASATVAGQTARVVGTLSSAPGLAYRVELFASPACDPSGFGEGQTFLRAATVSTDGSGHAPIAIDVPGLAVGQQITATVTSIATNDTSEFSNCAPARQAGIVVSPPSGAPSEVGGAATFTVALAAAPTADVQLALAVSDQTEAAVSPTSLTFSPASWNAPQTVTVTGLDDTLDDGNVAFTVTIGPSTSADPAYSGLTAPAVALTNLDDDAGGTLAFTSGALTVSERDGSATLTVVRTGGAASGVTVRVQTVDGTATNGSDYMPISTMLTFGPGESSKAVTLTVVNDNAVEPDEQLTVTLNEPTGGAVLGTPGAVLVTVVSDDVEVSQPTACSPRPPVRVRTQAVNGQLLVRVEVQKSSLLSANSVSQITFTRLENATPVTANGASISTVSPMVLPSGTETVEFTVRRERPREAATVHFTVRDACGEWKTFVGGGPDAF